MPIIGGDGNDLFLGTGVPDWFVGAGGNDTLLGRGGGDRLEGGSGDDVLEGEGGADELLGGDGNDVLSGGPEADTIDGGSGIDTLEYYGGADTAGFAFAFDGSPGAVNTLPDGDVAINVEAISITGGSGNDTLTGGDGNDILIGGAGLDSLDGGAGIDTLGYDGKNDTAGFSFTFNGTPGATNILPDGDIATNFEAVWVVGGSGADSLTGGNGNDVLFGYGGNDTLSGGGGNDSVSGGDGANSLDGGDGIDTIRLDFFTDFTFNPSGVTTLPGGTTFSNFEAVQISGTSGADRLTGSTGNDTLYGWGYSDSSFVVSDRGDTLNGGAGDDLIYGGFDPSLVLFLVIDSATEGDLIDGGDGNDTIYGQLGPDTINGGSGNDVIHGGNGGSSLDGGTGNDALFAGDGNDTLSGDAGDDLLDGQYSDNSGTDQFFGGDGNDTIIGSIGWETLSGRPVVTNLISGGSGADVIYTGLNADTIDAGDGNDHIVVRPDNQGATVNGGGGEDSVSFEGSRSAALVYTFNPAPGIPIALPNGVLVTNVEAINISGGYRSDSITGGNGNDTINGASGDDTLTGGAGNDVLVASSFRITDGFTGIVYGGGPIVIDGGTGQDTAYLDFGEETIPLTFVLEPTPGVVNALPNGGWVTDVEVISFTGGRGNDGLVGGTGNDTLNGGAGDDFLYGRDGADRLDGGAGADTLLASAGADTLTGGAGKDTFIINYDGAQDDLITDYEYGEAFGALALGDASQVSVTYDSVTDRTTLGIDTTGDGTQDGFIILAGNFAGARVVIDGSTFYLAPNTTPVAQDGTVSVSEDGTLTGQQVVASDADAGDTLSYALVGTAPAGLTFNPDGSWSYDPPSSFDSLPGGQNADVTFQFTASDGLATSNTATIDITVQGVNDAATIGGDTTGAVTEDSGLLATGALTVTEVDTGEESFGADTIVGAYGTLSIGTDGAWSYDLDDTLAAVQALGAGDTMADTLTVASFDGTTQNIVVTITGANDAATIGGDTAGAVTEDSGLLATGTLTVSDVDTGEASFAADTIIGSYGTLTIGTNGAWSYDLTDSLAAVQALGAGDTLSDTVTVESADGTTQAIVVTINGANDAASIGGDTAGAVTEDSGLLASGTLSISDVDSGEASFSADTLTGSYGTLSIGTDGAWSYDLDDTLAAVQALGAGDTMSDTVTVESFDGTTQNIVISITGVNDAAVIGGDTTGAVTEDSGLLASGTLTVSDVDTGEASFAADTIVGSYGTLSIGTNGAWSYDLDDTLAAVQALGAGDTMSDTVTVASADGTTQSIVVTIAGANDAASIGGDSAGSIYESAVGPIIGGLTIVDIDVGEGGFRAGTYAGLYGSLRLLADGTWLYEVDRTNPVFAGLDGGERLTDTITAVSLDGTTQEIVVTIRGVYETFGGSGGADRLAGTAGADALVGLAGDDTLSGGDGDDTLDGGEGFDLADYSGDAAGSGNAGGIVLPHGIYADLGAGFVIDGFGKTDILIGVEGLIGTDGGYLGQVTPEELSDVLIGDAAANRIEGRGGLDYILSNGGADTILAGNGDDIALGGDGDDSLQGDAGDDFLIGEDGSDTLEGGAGDDWLIGAFWSGPSTGLDLAHGGAGDDVIAVGDTSLSTSILVAHGEAGDDTIYGGGGADTLVGGTGSDYLWGAGGADVFRFEAGDLTSGDMDIVLMGSGEGDLLSFDASYTGQVSAVAGSSAGVSGVYLSVAVAGGTWMAWLPYQTVASVEAALVYG